jgi:hypothetical protein
MRLGGLLLKQYAGVTAALDEGLSLSSILAQEQIAEADWTASEHAWREAIVDSIALQLELAKWTREAEDALHRKLDPVDSDPVAWAGLLAALAAAPDGAKLLADLGLKMTDMARLGRRWRRRCEADPGVVKQLSDAAGKAPAPARIRAERAVLRLFPWSPKPNPAPADMHGERTVEGDVDLYAAFVALAGLAPSLSGKVNELCGLDVARLAALSAAWRSRLEEDPALNAAYTVKLLDHRAVIQRILAGARVA